MAGNNIRDEGRGHVWSELTCSSMGVLLHEFLGFGPFQLNKQNKKHPAKVQALSWAASCRLGLGNLLYVQVAKANFKEEGINFFLFHLWRFSSLCSSGVPVQGKPLFVKPLKTSPRQPFANHLYFRYVFWERHLNRKCLGKDSYVLYRRCSFLA